MLVQEQQAEIINEVLNWYQIERSWQGFESYYYNLHPIKTKPTTRKEKPKKPKNNDQREPRHKDIASFKPLNSNSHTEPKKQRINQHGILDANKQVLIQFLTFKSGDVPPDVYLSNIIPITFEQKIIAWLVPKDGKGISLKAEKKIFFEHTNQVLILAIFIALLVATVLGVMLAKYLVQPIEALTQASKAMAKGSLQQSIKKTTHDELGDLADSFNQMSSNLTLADTQRRQMTADIAHDLGTPLQVISGYIEMAQELNKPLDHEKLDIISTEISHIKRLLSDLSILSEADEQTLSVSCAEVNIRDLFERIESAYKAQCQRANVHLALEVDLDMGALKLDEERMVQILGNLMSNALRYTPKGGSINLRARREVSYAFIEVIDDGVGIAEEHQAFILTVSIVLVKAAVMKRVIWGWVCLFLRHWLNFRGER